MEIVEKYLPKKIIILPRGKAKIIATNDIKYILSPKKLDVDKYNNYYIVAENKAYAIVQIKNIMEVNKNEISAKDLENYKVSTREYNSVFKNKVWIYEIEKLESFNYKPLIIMYPFKKDNLYTTLDSFRDISSDYESNFNNFDVGNVIKINIDEADNFDVIKSFLDIKKETLKDFDIELVAIPKSYELANIKQIDNVDLDGSKTYILFSYPRGIVVKLVKMYDTIKLYNEKYGDITDLFPSIVDETRKISDNNFEADGILYSPNTSIITLEGIISKNIDVEDAYIDVFNIYKIGNKEGFNYNYMKKYDWNLKNRRVKIINGIKINVNNEEDIKVIEMLYKESDNGIGIIENNTSKLNIFHKGNTVEKLLVAKNVEYKDGFYFVDTELGELKTVIPVVKGKYIVAKIGENIFKAIDSYLF